ncbi:unnamed protein product [Adineta ricciae]|uniref:Transmembrane protein n=1 Tax=Adineta ricciae TaxID=249248 RepID=A0A815UUL5_ADIRI|nr:unnamed protein product [Adineta ricciae]
MEGTSLSSVANTSRISSNLSAKVKSYLRNLNLFPSIPPSTNEYRLRSERIATRLYIILLMLSLYILVIYTSLITVTEIVAVSASEKSTVMEIYRKPKKGQIVLVELINNEYKCQGRGGMNITETENLFSCNDCRCRVSKERNVEDFYVKLKIFTFTNEEYNLKATTETISTFLNDIVQPKNNDKVSVGVNENLNLLVGVNTQFVFYQHTDFINSFQRINEEKQTKQGNVHLYSFM